MTDNIKTNEVAEQTSFNMEKYRFKETPHGVRIFINVLKYVVLVVACLMVLVPLVVVLLGSLKSHQDFLKSGAFELPKVVELSNFKTAFIQGNVAARQIQALHIQRAAVHIGLQIHHAAFGGGGEKLFG